MSAGPPRAGARPSKSRSAIDCLRRGGLSLRANAGLIPLVLLQSLLVTVLFVVSLLPPFFVLGGTGLLQREWSAAAFEQWITGLGAELAAQPVPFALALLASTLLGILAVFVWGWFQGGLFGTLVAAERQALPDAENRAGGSAWFRTFGWTQFAGWGGRYAWRYFWFFHLMLTVGLLLGLVAVLIAVGVGLGYGAWGGGAAYGIGCGASLPFLFAFAVFSFWSLTAQPYLAWPEAGVGRASRAGLRLVGRRPGAVLLIAITLFVLGVAAMMVGLVAELSTTAVLGERSAAWVAAYAVLTLLQMLVSAALGVFGNAAVSSLAISEAPELVR